MPLAEQLDLIDAVQETREQLLRVEQLLKAQAPAAEITHAMVLANNMAEIMAYTEAAAERHAAELRSQRADDVRHGIALEAARQQAESGAQEVRPFPALRLAGQAG